MRADEIAGCYALYSEEGRLLDGSFYNSSPLVRLDTARAALPLTEDRPYRMVRLDTAGRPMVPYHEPIIPPHWTFDPATGALHLAFVDGFSGVTLSLYAPPGARDTLYGMIQDNWDFGPATQRLRSASAVRISCR